MDEINGFRKYVSARVANIASPTFGSGTSQTINSFNGFLTDMQGGSLQSFNAEDVILIEELGVFSNFADGLVMKDNEGTIPISFKLTNESPTPNASNLITFKIPAFNAMFKLDWILPRVGSGSKKFNVQMGSYSLLSSSISTAFNTQPLHIHVYAKILHAFAMS